MTKISDSHSQRGFTLIEISIAVAILGIMLGVFLKMYSSRTDSSHVTALQIQLDQIEEAIFSYRLKNDRLPCPADPTLAATSASFGVETSPGGTCTNANLLAYPTASTTHKAGGVPVRALGLPDSAAIDPWGKKILYVVELTATGNSAFTTYPVNDEDIGAITIYDESGTGTPRSIRAVYVLMSAGRNGHGAFMAGSSARFNAGSTNADELVDCACTSAAVAASPNLNITFYQMLPTTTDAADPLKTFDDVVRFKTRAHLASYTELQ